MVLGASAPEAASHAAIAGIPVALPSSTEAAPAAAAAITSASFGGKVDNAPQQPITALMPGFRFHPSDEELVLFYLKRKICGKSFLLDVITDVDVYDIEPWELQAKGQIKTRDQEWYFFSKLDRKYPYGVKMRRSTNKGYWKTTGADRVVKHNNCTVGLKKTLVFHHGRAPDGNRTDWVMHEYRLAEEELNKCGIEKEIYVLCRIFQKTKIGPPVGNRCAPFVEEEWNDEDAVLPGDVAGEEAAASEASASALELLSEAVAVPHIDLSTETGYPLDVYNNKTRDFSPALDDGDNTPSILRYKRRKADFNSQASTDCGPVPQSPVGASAPNSSLPPECMGFIGRLQEEVYKVSMDRETLRHEVFSVRALNNALCSMLKKLVKENEELNYTV